MNPIVLAILLVGGIGLVAGAGLAIASVLMAVPVDEKAEAIEAALYPAKTDYLFFVLDSSGKHCFAKTFAEHQENMRK